MRILLEVSIGFVSSVAVILMCICTHSGAVQRKYESQRRLCLLEDKENCDETLNTIAKMKRYRSRKERVTKIHSF